LENEALGLLEHGLHLLASYGRKLLDEVFHGAAAREGVEQRLHRDAPTGETGGAALDLRIDDDGRREVGIARS
jgi:hypothetical protein